MEALMTIKNRQDHEAERPAKLDFEAMNPEATNPEAMNPSGMNSGGMDSSGMCFALAAVLALLVAGTIVYRAANNDMRMASSGATSASVSHLR
jgi:hypothetical protein